jgi:6-phosphogluconate dehydrogenase
MQIGMIGLGRMGANMVQRLLAEGHTCVVYARTKSTRDELAALGAQAADSLEDMVHSLQTPRPIWIMVPDQVVDDVIEELVGLLSEDDIIIDGGNSYFPDDLRRAQSLKEHNIRYVDVGTSGGVWGRERGYCLMIGGENEAVNYLEPVFRALAPGEDAAPVTPGRKNDKSSAHRGYLHCGGHGAGHFVKMVHNGIEYGVMAAYGEGFAMLHKARQQGAEISAGNPVGELQLDADTGEIAELWRRGSVVGSWLLDLAATSLHQDPLLKDFSGDVSDSGEGRWTVKTAVDLGVPTHVLAAALFNRFSSRGEANYANKVLSALRYAFGGHVEKS